MIRYKRKITGNCRIAISTEEGNFAPGIGYVCYQKPNGTAVIYLEDPQKRLIKGTVKIEGSFYKYGQNTPVAKLRKNMGISGGDWVYVTQYEDRAEIERIV